MRHVPDTCHIGAAFDRCPDPPAPTHEGVTVSQPEFDLDVLVIPKPEDCSEERWDEIGRLAERRFKELTAKAACPSWCFTEHDA